jgi:hypothetical protein
MAKYIVGIDLQQNLVISIPVEGSIVYPDLSNVRNTVNESAQKQRKIVNDVIGWLQENNAPPQMINFIASNLGSRIDNTLDFHGAELMVNNGGILYTLKKARIVDGIEEVLKIKQEQSDTPS